MLKIQTRDASVDSLRGLAVVLMVSGHVIGGTADEGMRVAADSAWRHSYELLADMRMPLFTGLSGLVYGFRPLKNPQCYGSFVWGKTRRLLVPLVIVGTLFVTLQALTPGTNTDSAIRDVWKVYIYGLGHFWFLQAIFLILLVVGVVDALGWIHNRRVLAGAVAVTGVLSMLVRVPAAWDIFSVNGFFRLLPFFLLGYLLSSKVRSNLGSLRWLLVAATTALLTARAAEVFGWVAMPTYVDRAVSLALGLAAISSLLVFREALKWQPLAWLGYFSFAIYLLHVFGTAPTRMLLDRLGIESEPLVFLAALAAGLALPVFFEVFGGRVRWVSSAFLGQKPWFQPTS